MFSYSRPDAIAIQQEPALVRMLSAGRHRRILQILIWCAIAGFVPFFVVHTFLRGWTEVNTDFPNYYTAAVLARKHMPLEHYYDWQWFQRQMNYAGWDMQLGGYTPQTPLTLFPVLPLSGMRPMDAKRAWLVLNLAFLAGSVLLLARAAKIPATVLFLLVCLGYPALHANFLLGQYYVFLLFLLASGVWCLLRGNGFAGGMLFGIVCMLKLYTAPFFIYFAWKRQWRAFAGMATACLGLGILSLAWFGWNGNLYFIQSVLPRAMECMILDPYNAGIGTTTQLLRHLFIPEAELNPHPLLQAPWVFFFLRSLLVLGIFVLTVLTLPREAGSGERRDLAWFFLCLFLLTPNLASYVMVLLLVPIALLLAEAEWQRVTLLAATYILLCAPLRPWWSALYPRVWLIAILYAVVGAKYWRNLQWRPLAAAAAVVSAWAVINALYQQREYLKEPPTQFEPIATEAGAIYASNPATSNSSVVYEAIADQRYELKRMLKERIEPLRFNGLAFHPSLQFSTGNPIVFELVAHEHSQIVSYDVLAKRLTALTRTALDATKPAVSPDGRRLAFISRDKLAIAEAGVFRQVEVPGPVKDVAWFPQNAVLAFSGGVEGQGRIFSFDLASGSRRALTSVPGDQREPAISPDGGRLAFTVERRGVRQIWTQDLHGGVARQLTGGACNSFAPTWEGDSEHVVFASDCRRGLGLPALYRARVK